METQMLENDKIIQKNCDTITLNNAATVMTMSFTSIMNAIQNIDHCDDKSNNACSTTIALTATEANATDTTETQTEHDQQSSETEFRRQIEMQKFESLQYNSTSMMSCCSKDEIRIKEESDSELREDELFYDSTNANKNFEEQKTEKDFNLTKLYLNDFEIASNEEERTVTDMVKAVEKDNVINKEQNKSMRVAFNVILRLLFPLANGVVQRIRGIRGARFLKVLNSIASSRQALTNLFAFAANTISLNLSSVQVSHRIEPILKLLKIRKSRDDIESLPDSPTSPHGPDGITSSISNDSPLPAFSPFSREPRYSLPNFQASNKKISLDEYMATKCCTLNILAEPPPGQPIRADIVFIHGLHGSLVNTWKQGLWENERRPVEFERPPKPPVRPPKRPRHSRSSSLRPPHHKKRARFAYADVSQRYSHERDSIDEADENSYSFICGEPNNVQICDGIEYSFPTFRLRLNDNGRLLQAEHSETHDKLNKNNHSDLFSHSNESNKEQAKKQKSSKPSPNDPNYSKCWPGDWLPIDCPGVRVIAVNYTTDQHLWRPLWKKKEPRSNLIQRSREMTELLIKHRVGYGHPIVWVGHSKGGLFIKQIIVDAWESGRPAAAPFWRSARGVFFYSVPHRGSHLASIKAPLLSRSVELIDIEKNNKYLLDLHRRFAGLYRMGHLKVEVFSFVETALTLMSVLYMRIVGADSADPGIGDVCGIRLDHREICKPRSRDCILYKQLVNMINKVC